MMETKSFFFVCVSWRIGLKINIVTFGVCSNTTKREREKTYPLISTRIVRVVTYQIKPNLKK